MEFLEKIVKFLLGHLSLARRVKALPDSLKALQNGRFEEKITFQLTVHEGLEQYSHEQIQEHKGPDQNAHVKDQK